MISYSICIIVVSLITNSLGEVPTIPEGFTTAVQCKCADIEKCSAELTERTNTCKKEPQCESFLKKVGDPTKIRECLDSEHAQMQKLETCVKDKVGGILGCTNDENPKNLTIPLIPLIETPELPSQSNTSKTDPGQGPPELAHYLMCVDQCAMNDEVPIPRRMKRSPVNCAFKLR
ncbi:unnamed protein product [Enterobius vermicularis]|uniref:CLIP domain-containing serine protease n=1 Tax=Enterobius vermicularis TaxID=51028 RepID=A0A0N4V2X8_ENTVE|nr:unnamed protein product [Enterobius vermicularis]